MDFLCRLDQAEDDRAALGTVGSIGKEEILPVYHKRLDAALGSVVAQLQPTILEIGQQIELLFLQVVQRLA